jgi:enoyl-CoA hydratase/carnithine racemase
MTIRAAAARGVYIIEIARPEKKNALTMDMYSAMATALDDASADAAVRAVLIVGQPGIFTSGNDLEDFMKGPPTDAESPVFLFMKALMNCTKPVVAAVTGAAIGVGTTMLLHCDFVFVSDEARLALPFVSLGLVPEFGSSYLVPLLIGRVKAAEKLLLGDTFTGAEAVEFGIANAVLPASEVVNHARRVAERFNSLPPGAVAQTKQLMNRGRGAAITEAVDAESACFIERLRSPEAQEAFSAFFQKRRPDFGKF